MTNQLMKTALVPTTTLCFADVFSYPEYTLRGIGSWEDVAKLGSKNIGALVSDARGHEKSLTVCISKLKEQQNLLEGKSGSDFEGLAKQFENPIIRELRVPRDSWAGDEDSIEPTDDASKTRARDATTFNLCGWCKHNGSGTGRYNYMITTHCQLIRGDNAPDSLLHFWTPCLLQKMTAEQITAQTNRIKKEVADTLAMREKVQGGIKFLQTLKQGQPEKPYLTSLRPHDQFNVGDEAIGYLGQWRGEHNLIVDGKWVPVTIVYGYRYHDGYISAQALFPIHSNKSHAGGCGYSSGCSHAAILLRSEFDWLRHAATDGDLGFLGLWIANIDGRDKEFDRVRFLGDLTGNIALPPADWQPPADEILVRSVRDAERVLHMLKADLFETEDEIRSWANMQLREVHPDRLSGKSDGVKAYAARQTRAVYAARDLLIDRLRGRQK